MRIQLTTAAHTTPHNTTQHTYIGSVRRGPNAGIGECVLRVADSLGDCVVVLFVEAAAESEYTKCDATQKCLVHSKVDDRLRQPIAEELQSANQSINQHTKHTQSVSLGDTPGSLVDRAACEGESGCSD